jgi:uncharacterized protein YlxW (UPF0749 family)
MRLPKLPGSAGIFRLARVSVLARVSGLAGVSGLRWRIVVPVVCAVAGLIFAISAHTANGTDLRSSQSSANLGDLVRAAEVQVNTDTANLNVLHRSVSALTDQAGQQNAQVKAAQQQGAPLQAPAGLTGVTGPGIVVVLNDASSSSANANANVDPNQLVVHQSDMQSVVNALWAGGAEAMTIAGQRVIATSAVRCVGNTLLLNGRVFSPPFRVAAIGPYATMHSALDRSPGVTLFRQAADYYGLGYTVQQSVSLQLPAYDGPLSLSYAKVTPQ